MAANKTTFRQEEDFIEGTVVDIIGKGEKSRLRINGNPVSQPDLSALARLGLASVVGQVKTEGKRGKIPSIIRIPTNIPGMVVARR